VSKRKKQQPIEEEAVDKLDQFLATNSKKLLGGLAVILVVFLAVYAFNTMNKSRSGAMANKAGQLELLMTMSGGEKQHLDNYLTIAADYPKLADYVNLKAAEILVAGENTDAAKAPLASVSGDYAELAAGLKFDTGLGEVNAEQYIQSGKMTALWYYRACLAAEGAEKDKLIAEFKEKYPENELYKQIERWNG
jgi:predicted negative regulator of RcsB-dependent stress response